MSVELAEVDSGAFRTAMAVAGGPPTVGVNIWRAPSMCQ